jgi:hypothetical protein
VRAGPIDDPGPRGVALVRYPTSPLASYLKQSERMLGDKKGAAVYLEATTAKMPFGSSARPGSGHGAVRVAFNLGATRVIRSGKQPLTVLRVEAEGDAVAVLTTTVEVILPSFH